MRRLHFDIDCPSCHLKIHVPFIEKLEAKAIKDFDMAEISAQDELLSLREWIQSASLITLLKYWLKRK